MRDKIHLNGFLNVVENWEGLEKPLWCSVKRFDSLTFGTFGDEFLHKVSEPGPIKDGLDPSKGTLHASMPNTLGAMELS